MKIFIYNNLQADEKITAWEQKTTNTNANLIPPIALKNIHKLPSEWLNNNIDKEVLGVKENVMLAVKFKIGSKIT